MAGRNLDPIHDLMEAQRIRTQYQDPIADAEVLKRISRAIGSEKPLPALENKLDEIFEPGTLLSDAVLEMALVETRKNKK